LPLKEQLSKIECEILTKAIETHKTTRLIARHLGIGQSSVVNKLKQYGLPTPNPPSLSKAKRSEKMN